MQVFTPAVLSRQGITFASLLMNIRSSFPQQMPFLIAGRLAEVLNLFPFCSVFSPDYLNSLKPTQEEHDGKHPTTPLTHHPG